MHGNESRHVSASVDLPDRAEPERPACGCRNRPLNLVDNAVRVLGCPRDVKRQGVNLLPILLGPGNRSRETYERAWSVLCSSGSSFWSRCVRAQRRGSELRVDLKERVNSDNERPRVYGERDRDDHDPRDAMMRDLDLRGGEERELVVDRDRVYELNGEDS